MNSNVSKYGRFSIVVTLFKFNIAGVASSVLFSLFNQTEVMYIPLNQD